MMQRDRSRPTPNVSTTEAAIDAMSAGELRSLIRDMLPWFDEALQARFATRSSIGPPAPRRVGRRRRQTMP